MLLLNRSIGAEQLSTKLYRTYSLVDLKNETDFISDDEEQDEIKKEEYPDQTDDGDDSLFKIDEEIVVEREPERVVKEKKRLKKIQNMPLSKFTDPMVIVKSLPHSFGEIKNITDILENLKKLKQENEKSDHRHHRKKQKVRFADDLGLDLIKVASISYIDSLIQQKNMKRFAENTSNNGKEELWCVDFLQPASQYVKFHNSLYKNSVCLENCLIKNDQDPIIVGTISVANLFYEKSVWLRITADSWKSHIDYHVHNLFGSTSKDFDKYLFEINLAKIKPVDKIEFAIGCRTRDPEKNKVYEFWDNNEDKNYRIIKKHPNQSLLPLHQLFNCDQRDYFY